ncbi:hypothetical protein CYY_009775 [Polysphondylium violaceum]|uniref:Uncharacterized protein n=1 Tax=Polysphondylium violaceum TaxID=133409 RepID=A0A8J4PT17_9MYCE|nr:hypothetical protein CYY_009775 [Polysphondylium violaceum]
MEQLKNLINSVAPKKFEKDQDFYKFLHPDKYMHVNSEMYCLTNYAFQLFKSFQLGWNKAPLVEEEHETNSESSFQKKWGIFNIGSIIEACTIEGDYAYHYYQAKVLKLFDYYCYVKWCAYPEEEPCKVLYLNPKLKTIPIKLVVQKDVKHPNIYSDYLGRFPAGLEKGKQTYNFFKCKWLEDIKEAGKRTKLYKVKKVDFNNEEDIAMELFVCGSANWKSYTVNS